VQSDINRGNTSTSQTLNYQQGVNIGVQIGEMIDFNKNSCSTSIQGREELLLPCGLDLPLAKHIEVKNIKDQLFDILTSKRGASPQ